MTQPHDFDPAATARAAGIPPRRPARPAPVSITRRLAALLPALVVLQPHGAQAAVFCIERGLDLVEAL